MGVGKRREDPFGEVEVKLTNVDVLATLKPHATRFVDVPNEKQHNFCIGCHGSRPFDGVNVLWLV